MSEAFGSCIDPGHCITCGDQGIEMRVLRVDDTRDLALCEDAEGTRSTVDIGVVDAGPGAQLIVHAGVAIARLEDAR